MSSASALSSCPALNNGLPLQAESNPFPPQLFLVMVYITAEKKKKKKIQAAIKLTVSFISFKFLFSNLAHFLGTLFILHSGSFSGAARCIILFIKAEN